jgi:hypothetical protein
MTHQPVEVTQSDRDAAAYTDGEQYALHPEVSQKIVALTVSGSRDKTTTVQSFARYRIATEQAVIDRTLSDGAVTAAGIAFYSVPPFHGQSINGAMQAAITAALNYRETKDD